MNMGRKPEWLKEAPKWFQDFYGNDFTHFAWKIEWSWRLQLITTGAILAGAITILCLSVP